MKARYSKGPKLYKEKESDLFLIIDNVRIENNNIIYNLCLPTDKSEGVCYTEEEFERTFEEKYSSYLLNLVPNLPDFTSKTYLDMEELLIKGMQLLGFRNIHIWTSEGDSFGPLIRSCSAIDPDGNKYEGYYG